MAHSLSPFSVSGPVSRRSFLSLAGAALAGAALRPRLWAQTAHARSPFIERSLDTAAKAQLSSKMLRGDVGVISGAGGNVGVLKAPDGALLVDSSYSTAAEHLWQQVNALGVEKVPLLINTHWHLDHTDGNAALHARGARILAHERTRHWLTQAHVMTVPGVMDAGEFPPAPAAGVPQEVMTGERTVKHGAETVHLRHHPAAHTDSDIAVHFQNANVLHTGDLFFNGIYPFIDPTTGGTIQGMAKQGRAVLKLADKDTIIIPGHGPVGSREDYAAFLDMLDSVSGKVSAMKRAGKSADEVVAAKPTADFDAKYAHGMFTSDQFARLAYATS
jgi:glyoxylase-like metal-dependent hydrolase (beta-lactamase superfamily II)